MDSELLTLPDIRGQLRQEALRLVDQIVDDLQASIVAPRDIEENGTDSVIEGALHNREKELSAVEKLITIIVQEYHAVDLNISRQAFKLELRKLESRVDSLMGDTLVIRACRFELGGRLLDDMVWAEDGGPIRSVWPQFDSLISSYKMAKLPFFKPKNGPVQWEFCKRVFKEYNVEDGRYAWCVVSGTWHHSKNIRGVQIVRNNVGEPCARYLFGPLDDEGGHLMGARNGLPMCRDYADDLDSGRIVLIPDESQDEGKEKAEGFITSGWWRAYLAAGPGRAWAAAASGNYLCPSMLQRLAQRVGRLTEEEAAEFAVEVGNGRIAELSDEKKHVAEKDSFYSDACYVVAKRRSIHWSNEWTKFERYNQNYQEFGDDGEDGEEEDDDDEDGEDDLQPRERGLA
ncbi:hypothetical protein ACQKWADRAFT_323782 [Trichoderma austrokoningii]